MKDTVSRLHQAKKDDPIMATTYMFGEIIDMYPSEDGNR